VDTFHDAPLHVLPGEAQEEANAAREEGRDHEENLGFDLVDPVPDAEEEPHEDERN